MSTPSSSTLVPHLKIVSSRYYVFAHRLLGLFVLAALIQIAIAVATVPALLLAIPLLELWKHTRQQPLEGAVLTFFSDRWQLSLAGQYFFVQPSPATLLLPFCVRLTLLEVGDARYPMRHQRWSCILFNDSSEPAALRYMRRQLNLQQPAKVSSRA